MSSSTLTRSQLDRSSAIPSIPGLPAVALFAILATASFIALHVSRISSGEEHRSLIAIIFGGAAVVCMFLSAGRALYAAMIQPPLILVAATIAYLLIFSQSKVLRDNVISVALAVVQLFPIMFLTEILVIAVGSYRIIQNLKAQGTIKRKPTLQDKPRQLPTRAQMPPKRMSTTLKPTLASQLTTTLKPADEVFQRDSVAPRTLIRNPAPAAASANPALAATAAASTASPTSVPQTTRAERSSRAERSQPSRPQHPADTTREVRWGLDRPARTSATSTGSSAHLRPLVRYRGQGAQSVPGAQSGQGTQGTQGAQSNGVHSRGSGGQRINPDILSQPRSTDPARRTRYSSDSDSVTAHPRHRYTPPAGDHR